MLSLHNPWAVFSRTVVCLGDSNTLSSWRVKVLGLCDLWSVIVHSPCFGHLRFSTNQEQTKPAAVGFPISHTWTLESGLVSSTPHPRLFCQEVYLCPLCLLGISGALSSGDHWPLLVLRNEEQKETRPKARAQDVERWEITRASGVYSETLPQNNFKTFCWYKE